MIKAELVFAALFSVMVVGCASPERVVLLPDAGAKPTAVTISTKSGVATLAEPYAEAVVSDREALVGKTDAQTVAKRYGNILAATPSPARKFLVYFATGNDLTAESLALLSVIQLELVSLPAPEVIVIGHTDRVGSLEANDTLSAKRAEFIRDKLVSIGILATRINTAGRGEREPLVPTEDEVAEPKNRRVEIKIR
jgi:outer membrane protein OmpA-like peptidoglycan-associated protein